MFTTSAMLTACDETQTISIGVLQSKQEYNYCNASECSSHEFLRVHRGDILESLACKILWSFGPKASCSSPGPFPLTLRPEHASQRNSPASAF